MSVFSGKKESDLETDKESIQQHIEALANSISIDDETNTSEILKTTSDRLCSVLKICGRWDDIINWIYQVSEIEKYEETMIFITKDIFKLKLSKIFDYMKEAKEKEFDDVMKDNDLESRTKLEQWNIISTEKKQIYEELENAINQCNLKA